MIALTENPAVLTPRKTLSKAEQDALLKIGFYRRQRVAGYALVQVGPARFNVATIDRLKRHKLLRGEVPSLAPTEAGELAIQRLRGDL